MPSVFIIILPYLSESEVCITCGRHENCLQNFGRENLKRRDHSEDLGVDGNILDWILLIKDGKA
jgi:hypothetical protein